MIKHLLTTVFFLLKRIFRFKIILFFLESIFIIYWYFNAKKNVSLNRKNRIIEPRLFWGDVPIVNNMYWSNALKSAGYVSETVMSGHYSNLNKGDFNLYFDDILDQLKIPYFFVDGLKNYFIFDYILKNYNILHLCCTGTSLQNTRHSHLQSKILRWYNIKSIVIPYGGDYQQYSKMLNISLRNALMISYPETARNEEKVFKDVSYWVKNADIFFGGFQIDGIGRWDLLPFNMITIDTKLWKKKKGFSNNDGKNGPVRILHTPNHRGVKGTEFIINAIEELKTEGLNIKLTLQEGVPNNKVRETLQDETDILIEQIIGGAYAMSAIEGMASSVAVITNLEEEVYTRVFRRYSYLNECPILSANPENIKEQIKSLVVDFKLRNELSKAGRLYVEKYHSQRTAIYMFNMIYKNIWHNEKNDLINMFHPLMKQSYNNQNPIVEHSLKENRIKING